MKFVSQFKVLNNIKEAKNQLIMSILSAKELTLETRDAFVADLIQKCNDILKEYPENRCTKYAAEYLQCEDLNTLSNDGM